MPRGGRETVVLWTYLHEHGPWPCDLLTESLSGSTWRTKNARLKHGKEWHIRGSSCLVTCDGALHSAWSQERGMFDDAEELFLKSPLAAPAANQLAAWTWWWSRNWVGFHFHDWFYDPRGDDLQGTHSSNMKQLYNIIYYCLRNGNSHCV